jgi:histone arginine demethylase JMJD6
MAEYNPSPLTTDEKHTRIELYEKLKAREQALDPKEYIHRFPDAEGHFDTLKGDYVRDQDPAEVSRKITDAKRRKKAIRPADWYKFNYHKTHLNNEMYKSIESIDRFDYRDVSYEWFVHHYERASVPCMISGFGDNWGINKYTYTTMSQGFLRDERVKVGKDDEGYPIRIETRNYVHYASENKDDSPVYLFESQLAANKNISKLFNDYARPSWFSKDLFDYCHSERRPPHRWLCVGPERSGTTVHIDPLNTNAWNYCVAGRKLWILFAPDVPEDIATGTRFMSKGSDRPSPNIENEAIGWYDRVYVPKIRPFLEANPGKYRCIEAIQYPGETIFVPSSPQGWWHFVLNLDDTLAVTSNLVVR